MTPQEFEQVAEIFEAARHVATAERGAFLDERCRGRPHLRTEVEAFLGYHDAEDPLTEAAMQSAVGRAAASWAGALPAESAVPETIGPYRIVRRIGEGGMGTVFEAEQAQPRRRVALKVMRAAMLSPQVHRRFELEAELLGRLQHPGIARIYEAGVAAPGGAPYFAMEFIEGRSLTAHARAERLPTRARLQLLARICDAVQYAHQQGVIHRDLKPANILVTPDGQPRILDFGVARLADADGGATLRTDIGQLIGTLPYMSPEQIAGDPTAIDTRSDVYALGVLGYELLAGRLPYAVPASVVEAARIIQSQDPAPLSSVNRSWRGDIETIVARALEKDVARRYQTAAQLAADIRRHLADEPIIARPATTLYQLRKFARRHRGAVIGIGLAVLTLIVGIITTSVGLLSALRANRLAEQRLADVVAANDLAGQRLAEAEAVTTFLEDMLTEADRGRSGEDLTVRQVLDSAADEIGSLAGSYPRAVARLSRAIGVAYDVSGTPARAISHLERALELRRAEDDDPAAVWGATRDLANAYLNAGDDRRAAELLDPLIDVVRTTTDLDARGRTLLAAGTLRKDQARFDEAIDLLMEACAAFAEHGGRPGPHGRAMNALAGTLLHMGRYAESEQRLREALVLAEAAHGPGSVYSAGILTNLGIVLRRLGRHEEAEPVYAEALEIQARRGADHPSTLRTQVNYATLLLDLDRLDAADATLSDVIERMQRTLGAGDDQAIALALLSRVRTAQERLDEAEDLMRRGLEMMRGALGDAHPFTATAHFQLASLLLKRERVDEAVAQALLAVDAYQAGVGPDHPATVQGQMLLGECYQAAGRGAEARAVLLAALERDAAWARLTDRDAAECRLLLGEVSIDLGDWAQAESDLTAAYRLLEAAESAAGLFGARAFIGLADVRLHGGASPADVAELLGRATAAAETLAPGPQRARLIERIGLLNIQAGTARE